MRVAVLVLAACGGKGDDPAPPPPQIPTVTVDAAPEMTGVASCDAKQVAKLDGATQIAGGQLHACVRKSDGTVACWGENATGVLGVGTNDVVGHVVQACNLTQVLEVAATSYHSCARLADGSVWCWGGNSAGQLGDGSKTDRNVPVKVAGVRRAKGVAVAGYESCALEDDGTVVCWGMSAGAPKPVPGIANAAQLAMGQGLACVINGRGPEADPSRRADNGRGPEGVADGGVQCWVGTAAPVKLPLTGVKSLSLRWQRGCAVKGDGTVACWEGAGDKLATIAGLSDVTMVATGLAHACVLVRDGRVACFGDNAKAQLGDRGPSSDTPRFVRWLEHVETIGAGHDFTCARRRKESISCWGEEPDGTPPPERPAGPCPPDHISVYRNAGCGSAAVATCVRKLPPCADEFCGCDGKVIGGCGAAVAPFKRRGKCP